MIQEIAAPAEWWIRMSPARAPVALELLLAGLRVDREQREERSREHDPEPVSRQESVRRERPLEPQPDDLAVSAPDAARGRRRGSSPGAARCPDSPGSTPCRRARHRRAGARGRSPGTEALTASSATTWPMSSYGAVNGARLEHHHSGTARQRAIVVRAVVAVERIAQRIGGVGVDDALVSALSERACDQQAAGRRGARRAAGG